jgi:DNA-directed RNA polymerase specialized sigma24 family protein
LKAMSSGDHGQTPREGEGEGEGECAALPGTARGDERAFGRLVEQHRAGLELFCYLMLGDDGQARRAMSDTVLTAWRERELLEPGIMARMWLYRIAVGACDDAPATRDPEQ